MIPGHLLRRGRTVLVLAAAVSFLAMIVSTIISDVRGLGITLLAATGAAAILFLASPTRRHPDDVLVADGGFTVPGDGGLVLMGIAHLALIASTFVLGVHDPAWAAWLVLLILVAAPFPLYAPGLWTGTGVTLTPDGIEARKQSGPVLVRWTDLTADQPAPEPDGTIVLGLTAPAAGPWAWPIDPDRLPRHDVLAAAIRYYAAHPAARPSIGTSSGYAELRAALEAEPPLARRARSSRATRDAGVGGAVVVISALVYFWTDHAFAGHGLINVLPLLLAVPAVFGAGMITGAFTATTRHREPADHT